MQLVEWMQCSGSGFEPNYACNITAERPNKQSATDIKSDLYLSPDQIISRIYFVVFPVASVPNQLSDVNNKSEW